MKLLICLAFSAFCLVTTSFAQAPSVVWHKVLGGFDGDYAYDIQPTRDGGYIVAGRSEGKGGDVTVHYGNRNIEDLWLVKLTSTGAIQWERTLGNLFLQIGGYVRQTPDGGYIVGGSSVTADCSGNTDNYSLEFWLVKLREDGTVAWERTYGGTKHEYLYAIDLTPDGGYIFAGHSESNDGDISGNHGGRDLCVVKVDANGNLQWQKSFGGSDDDLALSIGVAPDGGYFLAGGTNSSDGDVVGSHGQQDYWVLKLDEAGALQWQKCLGGSDIEEAWSVQPSSDGGCIVAGAARSNDGDITGHHGVAGSEDWWVVKLNAAGNVQWEKSYGGNFNDQARHIQKVPDGGYVIAGAAESMDGDATCNAGVTDMWVVKINSTGNLEWQKSIGGKYFDEAFCVQPLADGSFIVAGHTCSKDVAGWHEHNTFEGTCADFFIVKLSAPGAPPQSASLSISSGQVCAGLPATLEASAQYVGINPMYQWTRKGVAVGTNSPYYTASDFGDNEVISCTVRSGGTCEPASGSATASYMVRINKKTLAPTISITASQTEICACTPVTFTAKVENGGTAPMFQWKWNGALTNGVSATYLNPQVKVGDVISCIYTDASGCIAGGEVTSNTINIGFDSQPVASVNIKGPDGPICRGSVAIFNASAVNAGAAPIFQWKVNNRNAGANSSTFSSSSLSNGDVVTCTITPGQRTGCGPAGTVTSNPVTVAISGAVTPSVAITPAAMEVCAGTMVTFTAAATNAGDLPFYQWRVNEINAGNNSNTFNTATLADGDVVSCVITADPMFICAATTTAASARIPVRVKTPLVPTVTIAADNNNVCRGTRMTFRATAQGAGTAPTFQWMLNDRPVGNSAVFENSALANGDQLYCQVTPAVGVCAAAAASSNIIVAVVYEKPSVQISPADTSITAGNSVPFAATVSGSINRFAWSPTDKLQSPGSLQPVTIALEEPVEFSLLVEGQHGCTATATARVRVFRQLFMPDAFSPNGDGLNEVFRIPAGSALNLKFFSVYDRWGNLVFTTSKIEEGWNGTFRGTPLNTGIYIYQVEGTDAKGTVRLKGNLLLMR